MWKSLNTQKRYRMELLKNFVYAGVGLAALTTDKVKETVEDLVEKGKISDTEGKKIIEEFFRSTESKKDDFESKMKSIGDNISSKFDFLKKEDDEVEALKKRIEELEAKLEKVNATRKNPSAKKTVAKK
jgi:polyhydroxyalkanoate synthesis regulator phasin